MKNKLQKLVALVLACAMVASLAACGGNGDNKETEKKTEAAGDQTDDGNEGSDEKEPYELVVQVGSEPGSLDPSTMHANDVFATVNHMFEGLTKPVSSTGWDWGMATGYELDETETIYTFTLRDDIFWSDGEPVTAHDFVYSWQRLVSGAFDYSYYLDAIVNAVEIQAGEVDKTELGVKAVDDKTFEVTLKAPCPYFLDSLVLGVTMPLREDIVEADPEGWAMNPETYISNGAFKLVEWSNQEMIVVEPNEYYYDAENVGPTKITFMLMDDDTSILAAYESGELQYASSCPTNENERMLEQGDLHITSMNGTYYVMINHVGDGVVEESLDPMVKRALALAIDRNYIVGTITGTGEVAADSWIGIGFAEEDGSDYHDTTNANFWDNDTYEANCEEAKKLLAEAGYPNGEGFPVLEYKTNVGTNHENIAAYLQATWKEVLGIDMKVVTEEWAVFLDSRDNGFYNMARGGWTVDYMDPAGMMEMWMTGNGNNDLHWSNAEYDAIVEQSRTEMNKTARYDLYRQAEEILKEELPMIPIYYYTDSCLYNEASFDGYFSYIGMPYFVHTTAAE